MPTIDCAQMGPGGTEAQLSVPILNRVRVLEEHVPGLEAKLKKHLGRERPRPVSGGGTLVARVEVLEEAVDTLLQAQVLSHMLLNVCYSADSHDPQMGHT